MPAYRAMHAGTMEQHQSQSTGRQIQQSLREAQRAWLDEVVRHTGRSLSEIAHAAGMSDSTLTRFRNKAAHSGVLSVLSVRKIADATRYPVTPEALGEPPGASATLAGLREPEAQAYAAGPDDVLAAAVSALIGNGSGRDAWLLRSRALEYEGYRPGDVLIVDLNTAPQPGDVVCVQFYDWQRGGAETVFRLYHPPILIGAGPDDAARQPRLTNDPNVAIKGVVLTALRGRAGRP